MLVLIYQTVHHHIPQDSNVHNHCHKRIPNLIGFIYLSLVHTAEVHNFYSASYQIKEDEMDGACSMYGEADTCMQHFSQIT
jgi:hypothetical protein